MKELLKKHEERIKHIKYAQSLYNEDYYSIYDINQFQYFARKDDYLFVGYHKIATDILTEFTFSGGVQVSVQNEEQNTKLQDFITESKLLAKLESIARNASITGDGICQLIIKDDTIDVILIPTENWMPIPNSLGECYPPIGHAIIRKYKKDKKDYYLIESHYAARVEYTAYNDEYMQIAILPLFTQEVKDITITTNLSNEFSLVQETNVDFPLVFQFKNEENFESCYGVSDYTIGSISKVKKMNELLNQRQYVIRMHGNPKMVVPAALINQVVQEFNSNNADDKLARTYNFENIEQARTSITKQRTVAETYIAQEIMRKMEIMPDNSVDGTSQFKYIEYNGKLEESEKQYLLLKEQLDTEMKMPKLLINSDTTLGTMSGEAIKRLLSSTLAKVMNKRNSMSDTLKMLVYTVLQIKGYTDAEYPSILWGDPLSSTLLEKIEANERMLASNIISQKKAIMNVMNSSDSEAEAMQAEIRQEANFFSDNSQN